MPYNKQIFVDGEVLTAEQLNNMEDGISAVTELVENGGGGEDGFSPVATVEQTDNGAVITITDKQGTTEATVTNGKTPEKGVDYFTPEDVEAIVADVTAQVEASFGGTYELVEEITTTEELTTISRTAFPDGTAYQFKAAKVKMVIAAGAGNGNINISYQNKDYLTLSISSVQTIATSQRYHWSRAWKEYGLWECEFSNASTSKFAVATYQMAGYNEIIDASNIERISIQATTSGVPIPIGTNIKIYGVRA